MKVYAKQEWSTDPLLKKWVTEDVITDRGCRCNPYSHVELIDHSSCIIGRIDITVCTTCDEIVSFDIVR